MDLDSDYCSNDSDGRTSSRTPTPKLLSQQLKQHGKFSNRVVFIVGKSEERIEVENKAEIMKKSPVLNALLLSDSSLFEIKAPQWDPKVFKIFIDYLLTDGFKAGNLTEFDEIIMLSIKYKVPKLLTQVNPIVKQSITLDNCINLYVLGATHDLEELRLAAYNFFLRMGNAFLEHQNFLELDCITLSILISSDDFPVVEITLFKRLKEWVVAQCHRLGYPPDRKEFYGRVAGILFRHVRYAQMTPKEFRNEVLNSGLLNETDIEAINLRHKTHPGLWHTLPPYQFVDRPRMTKMYNFAVPLYNNVQIGFRKIAGSCNTIKESVRFLVSHDIYLTSIGFFGPAKSDLRADGAPLTAYSIKIQIEGDYTKHYFRTPPQCATVITRDNFTVDLSHPFQIKKCQPYKLTVWIDGEVTQFGVFPLPQAIVLIQCKGELMTFHFSDADCDPTPTLEISGLPTSAYPMMSQNFNRPYKSEGRISGVIRCISFIIK
ncbi:BTB/POZ domain-containing protein 6 [Orchesella cincta]|uniref:BTB/POZ domain-containing protein 6 n=1 Tax=Orchesella cincta TaxID=48709 RepID=A0A1D2MQM5_ORCCI|nr:BTB/POZ domain-containing protein 6 [Orchesella cincta]